MAGGNGTLTEHVVRLEDFVGAPQTSDAMPLTEQLVRMNETIKEMETSFKGYVAEVDGKLASLLEDLTTITNVVKDDDGSTKSNVKDLVDEIVVLKRALNNESPSNSKVNMPEPKAFHGIRNAKELENFL